MAALMAKPGGVTAVAATERDAGHDWPVNAIGVRVGEHADSDTEAVAALAVVDLCAVEGHVRAVDLG